MDKSEMYRDLAHNMVDVAIAELSDLAHSYVDEIYPTPKPEFETAKEMRDRREDK